MSDFTSGFNEFYKKLDDMKRQVPDTINEVLETTGKQCIEDCIRLSKDAYDTGTMESSWEIREDNKQTGSHEDTSVISRTIWSSPDIIATNPKHPNGVYYPPLIEDGFDLPSGKHYKGKHMLKNAMTLCSKNLKANLKQRLSEVFNE